MALSIIPSRVSARPVGLALWMDRVLERAGRIEPRWRKGNIHALRVALRRSSTMAEALREVNPASEWRKIKKTTRGLLHALGKLRDTQVARAWMCKLTPPGDPVRAHLLRKLSSAGKEAAQAHASQALKDFDRESWRKWNAAGSIRSARFFPLEQCGFPAYCLGPFGRRLQSVPASSSPAQQHCLASHAHRYQTLPLCPGEFSAATLRTLGQRCKALSELARRGSRSRCFADHRSPRNRAFGFHCRGSAAGSDRIRAYRSSRGVPSGKCHARFSLERVAGRLSLRAGIACFTHSSRRAPHRLKSSCIVAAVFVVIRIPCPLVSWALPPTAAPISHARWRVRSTRLPLSSIR